MPPIKPLISVIIPVLNGERFLAAAVKSVLAQSYRPIEIIVVDDSSIDDTRRVAEKFAGQVRYIYQDNKGPSAARDTGIRASKADILAFIDADDLWAKDKLEIQLRLLNKHQQADIILGHLQYVIPKVLGEYSFTFTKVSRSFLGLSLGASLIRRSAFDTIGLLEPTMEHYEDVEWFLRARDADLPIVTHEEVVLYYILHGNNASRDTPDEDTSFLLRALKESIDRRSNREKGDLR